MLFPIKCETNVIFTYSVLLVTSMQLFRLKYLSIFCKTPSHHSSSIQLNPCFGTPIYIYIHFLFFLFLNHLYAHIHSHLPPFGKNIKYKIYHTMNLHIKKLQVEEKHGECSLWNGAEPVPALESLLSVWLQVCS